MTLRSATYRLLPLALAAMPASAQQPFRTVDPFYQGEGARRDFYSALAVSGELAYRSANLLQPAEGNAASPVALSVRLDYALLPQVDISGVFDLSGGFGRGPVGLSWLVVKPYWHNEGTDYAVRVAIDPASEGGLGFRQTDVAFLSTTAHSPTLTSDFSIGVRRVRAGYDTAPAEGLAGGLLTGEPLEADPFDGGDEGPAPAPVALAAYDRTRVIGRELHLVWGYNALFDPAGSSVSVAFVGEAGDYSLLRQTLGVGHLTEPDTTEERVRSGVGWLRAAVEWSRPSYQIAPYLSVPMAAWGVVRGETIRHGPRPDRARLGLRLTIR